MFTSENVQEFAERLAEHRPEVVFSMYGSHPVEYMETSKGEAAVIDVTLPEGVSIVGENGATITGTAKVGILLVESGEGEV
jgi:hypothetical protein